MIRVTIEMVPKGYGEPQHLGTVEIVNDAKGTLQRGNYYARLSRRGNPNSEWKMVRIKGFPRKRLGAYDLLYRILKQAVGNRNDGDLLTVALPCSAEDHTVCCTECGTHADPHRNCILR